MRRLGVAIRTCCFGLLLITSAAAFAAPVNVTCANTTADAVKLNTAIENSHSGDRIQIHGTCLLNATVVLLGDRTYEGDSRTGHICRTFLLSWACTRRDRTSRACNPAGIRRGPICQW